jgi:hypothetical protein
MATYQTYQEVGLKENISDIITNISPRKTPFQSSIGSEKVHQPIFQWQEDSLRSVSATTAVEGADSVEITAVPTVMRSNYTAIFSEAVKVSGSTQAAQAYGRAKELAYQMSKSAAALKRDLENAFVGTAASAAAGSAAVARVTASAQAQITGFGTSTFAAQSGNVFYMNTAVNLTETALVNAIQAAFVAGGDPTRILVTPSNSVIIASFASASGRYRTIQDSTVSNKTTLVNAVNLYVSPFGEQVVEVDRFLRAKHTLIYDPDMWSQATFRPWTRENLAKIGDSERQLIVGEFGLKHKNFSASALVLDNLASGS